VRVRAGGRVAGVVGRGDGLVPAWRRWVRGAPAVGVDTQHARGRGPAGGQARERVACDAGTAGVGGARGDGEVAAGRARTVVDLAAVRGSVRDCSGDVRGRRGLDGVDLVGRARLGCLDVAGGVGRAVGDDVAAAVGKRERAGV